MAKPYIRGDRLMQILRFPFKIYYNFHFVGDLKRIVRVRDAYYIITFCVASIARVMVVTITL